MELIFIFACALLGLVIGSFLNAAVYRLRIGEFKSLFISRSFCPNCKATLHVRDLVPLASYLLLRGKCRFCNEKISSHYFWVELITATVFGFIAWSIGLHSIPLLVWHLIFATILIFIASFDQQFGEIPDEISLPAVALALLGSFFVFTPSFITSLVGLIIGGGFFLLIVIVSNGKWMGGGDIRVGALLGALLGWQGFAIALFVASVLGSVVGIAQIVSKKRKLKTPLPFAPFLAAGGIIEIIFGGEIWSWYLKLLH